MRRQTNTVNWSTDLPLAQGIGFGYCEKRKARFPNKLSGSRLATMKAQNQCHRPLLPEGCCSVSSSMSCQVSR